MRLLQRIIDQKRNSKKQIAILIDPDKVEKEVLVSALSKCDQNKVDYILVGGSLLNGSSVDEVVTLLKESTNIPIILFPGSPLQLSQHVDATLFLSLLSGRNPEYLIGNHVVAAPYIKSMQMEVIPTGYLLIDGGHQTSVSYISNTTPIPANKPQIASATAYAGELLGKSLIYLDAGSGAINAISDQLIYEVANSITIPLIVGGGIRSKKDALKAFNAGADLIVVGNAVENNSDFIKDLADARNECNG